MSKHILYWTSTSNGHIESLSKLSENGVPFFWRISEGDGGCRMFASYDPSKQLRFNTVHEAMQFAQDKEGK